MVEVSNVTFDYPEKRALNQVSFQIEPGTITALVGPNGSGKTTLLRSIAALSKPISGEIRVNGYDTRQQPREVHREIGFLQDLFGLYETLTVSQCLNFMAYSRITDKHEVETALEIAIDQAGIREYLHKKVGVLSRGMRQRVGIAAAIVHQPALLLLDEPASGLDPEARYELSKLMVLLAENGMTIIVSSHILAELADYSTHMLVLQDGNVVEYKKLKSKLISQSFVYLEIGAETDLSQFYDKIKSLRGVSEIFPAGEKLHIKLDTQISSKHQFLRELMSENIPVNDFSEVKVNLQDEYIKTVSQYKRNKSR
jgi:ABC-2 type transport system ATP-binding protein